MGTAISFPILGNWLIDPVNTFEVFGFTVHIYGAIIAVGFLLAILYTRVNAKGFGLKFDDIIDFALLAVPICVVFARLFYVIFNFGIYRNDFWAIFKIWEGGLAFYGALIGGVISVIFFCRYKKLPIGPLLDIGCIGILIGQAVGRWGNFINREAFGVSANIDTFPLRMGLTDLTTGITTYVHPTFLYESLWYALGILLLHIYFKKSKKRFDGQICIMYFIWNGFGRAIVEGLRTDSLYLFGTGIRVSQALAIVFVAAGATLLLVLNKKFGDNPPKLWRDRVSAAETEGFDPQLDEVKESEGADEEKADPDSDGLNDTDSEEKKTQR